MKRTVFLLLLAALPLFAGDPAAIELDYFPGGGITQNSHHPIYWMWSPGSLVPPPAHFNLELYQGGVEHSSDNGQFIGFIAKNLALGKPGLNATDPNGSADNGGVFHWIAGTLVTGTAPAGMNYCVRAVTTDGQITSYCYHFDLVEPPGQRINLELIKDYLLVSDPQCPMCGIFDIATLLTWAGNPPDLFGELVLLHEGRRVAVLGRLGRGGLAAGQRASIRFTAVEMSLIRSHGRGFEVAIIGDTGNKLFSKPIRLRFSQ